MGIYKKFVDDLEIQKNNLVTALNNKGVEATNTETLNTLVPKVNNIQSNDFKETWILNENVSIDNEHIFNISFESNNMTFDKITLAKIGG